MSEQIFKKFMMDTNIVPAGVDLDLAKERTALIERWRTGQANAQDTHLELMRLYWGTHQDTNGQTKVYLMESSYQFPVEAGISVEEANLIYHKAQEVSNI